MTASDGSGVIAATGLPSLPPLRGEMSRSDRGGSSDSDQIGLELGSPPSAFGISPARGEKRT